MLLTEATSLQRKSAIGCIAYHRHTRTTTTRIDILSPITAVNALVRRMRWLGEQLNTQRPLPFL